MGHVYAHVRFTSPTDETRQVEASALVDTGATFSVLPAELASRLGLQATGRRRVKTAGGDLEMDAAWAFVEIEGQRGPTYVLISDKTDQVLLGVVTLEEMGLGVDPASGQLKQVEALLFSLE